MKDGSCTFTRINTYVYFGESCTILWARKQEDRPCYIKSNVSVNSNLRSVKPSV